MKASYRVSFLGIVAVGTFFLLMGTATARLVMKPSEQLQGPASSTTMKPAVTATVQAPVSAPKMRPTCLFQPVLENPEGIYAVTSCPCGTTLPMTFKINCSHLTDPSVKANCQPFITNVACNVYPAYKKITQIALENRCPTLTYIIYTDKNWPTRLKSEGAGGFSDIQSCQIDYTEEHSVGMSSSTIASTSPDAASPKLGPFPNPIDFHEILHQFQGPVTFIGDHPLFTATMAEAAMLVQWAGTTNVSSYQSMISEMQAEHDDFTNHPQKVTDCSVARTFIEEGLYLNDNGSIYKIYDSLSSASVNDIEAHGDLLLDNALCGASGDEEACKQYLVSHKCRE